MVDFAASLFISDYGMQETEEQIQHHDHNKHDQVAAIERWLFVKQEEHDAISLAEAYSFSKCIF